MKKNLIIAMACVAMTAGFTAAAQTEKKCDKQQCPKTEQCQQKQQCTQPGQCARPCEFEGLNLTDAQKAQIKTIKEEQFAQRKAAKESKKEAKAKAKGDRRAAREAARAEYLNKVKAVLTPEQYVQYLENQAKQPAKGKGMKPAMQKGKKGAKKFEGRNPEGRGPRQNAPRTPQPVQQQ